MNASSRSPSPRYGGFRPFRGWRQRRALAARFGLSPWKQLAFESAAKEAWRELERRNRNVFIADFDGATEPILMVFARRERVEDVRRAVNTVLAQGKQTVSLGGQIVDEYTDDLRKLGDA